MVKQILNSFHQKRPSIFGCHKFFYHILVTTNMRKKISSVTTKRFYQRAIKLANEIEAE
jgi:hypothetical protein